MTLTTPFLPAVSVSCSSDVVTMGHVHALTNPSVLRHVNSLLGKLSEYMSIDTIFMVRRDVIKAMTEKKKKVSY